MSNVTDFKLVVETIIGRSLPVAALTRIGNAYWKADPHSLVYNGDVVPTDPENPTNDEMAELFLKTLKKTGQHVLASVSDNSSDNAASAVKESNRATAVADME